MANQITINIGAAANDGTGDPLRTAFNDVNLNFANVWDTGLPTSNVQFLDNKILTVNTNANLVLAPNGIGKVASNVDIVPNTANVFALGGATRRWNTVYGQYLDLSHNATIGGNLTVTGNLSAGNISYTSNVFVGDLEGSVFDGASSIVLDVIDSAIYVDNYNYANGVPVDFGGNYSNANVAAYLPTYSGNISAGNAFVTNSLTASDVYSTRGTFSGDPTTGDASMYVGSPTFTNLGSDVMAQFTGNVTTYAQLNLQNYGNSNTASGDYIITADNGTDSTHFLDIGLTGSNWDGSQENSLGNRLGPNDGYLYVQDGDLVLGTSNGTIETWKFGQDGTLTVAGDVIPTANNTQSLGNATNQWSDLYVSNATIYMNNVPIGLTAGNILTVNGADVVTSDGNGNIDVNNIVSDANIAIDTSAEKVTISVNLSDWVFDETGVLTAPGEIETVGNISAGYFLGNGSQLTGIVSSYGNANVAAYLPTYTGNLLAGNVAITSNLAVGTGGNTNVLTVKTEAGVISIGNQNDGTFVVTDPNFDPSIYVAGQQFYITTNGAGNDSPIFTFGEYGTANVVFPGNLSLGDGVDSEIFNPANNISITANTASWTFGTDNTLTIPGNIVFADDYVYSGNTFTSPETNGVLKNFKWNFSDTVSGTDTVTLQWNLLDTTFPQWYLGTDSQNVIYTFDGEAQSLGLFANNVNSGTVTFGNAANNGAGTGNDIELTTVTGDVYIRAGSDSWKFDNNGDLTAPGNIITAGVIELANGTVIKDTSGNAVAIGRNAGQITQGSNSVAIGLLAGNNNQGGSSIAIGAEAGEDSQGIQSVAIGVAAGETSQGNSATALGSTAGQTNQGNFAIAVGSGAAYNGQGTGAIAVGVDASPINQGDYSIAIGAAVSTNSVQPNNSIIIDATASQLAATGAGLFVAPVRNDVGNIGNVVFYNTSTKEFTYGNTISVAGNITGGNLIATNSVISNVEIITGDVANASATKTRILSDGAFTYIQTGNGTADSTGNIVFSPYQSPTQKVVIDTATGDLTAVGNISGNTAGYAIGYRDIPQISFTGNATIATTDAGKHYYSTQSSNYILTIANNASEGFQVGAAISIVNQGTGNITIAQGSGVTLYLAGNATSGNRTLSTFGMATIMKVATDTWFINGTGVV
jgi:hypothetical protein